MACIIPHARRPDVTKYNPDPAYLRSLIKQIGATQKSIAEAFGLTDRVMRKYLSPKNSPDYRPAPYLVQFALEAAALTAGGTLTLLHG